MIVDPLVTYTREQVVANIKKAASAGPVHFDFLLKQAEIESGLNPNAKASTSTAAGPFQFVNGTWLRMVEKHGDAVGLSEQAAALRENRLDQTAKADLLAMRSDVTLSAKMAARLALDNAKALAASGQTNIGPAELYLAHFLGSAGASDFLSGMRANPNAPAADAVPAAARSNPNVFFANGVPRTFTEIYNRFAAKFNGVPAPVADTTIAAPNQPPIPQPVDGADAAANPPVDCNGIAKEAFADAQLVQKAVQRQNADRAQAVGDRSEAAADNLAEVTEAALAQYLAGFSKNYDDPSKTPLAAPQMDARDASRGASDDLHDLASAAITMAPPNVALGMKIVLAAAGQAQPKSGGARGDEPAKAAPAASPAVRQAVQWVSLFSDPRGADAAQSGRV